MLRPSCSTSGWPACRCDTFGPRVLRVTGSGGAGEGLLAAASRLLAELSDPPRDREVRRCDDDLGGRSVGRLRTPRHWHGPHQFAATPPAVSPSPATRGLTCRTPPSTSLRRALGRRWRRTSWPRSRRQPECRATIMNGRCSSRCWASRWPRMPPMTCTLRSVSRSQETRAKP